MLFKPCTIVQQIGVVLAMAMLGGCIASVRTAEPVATNSGTRVAVTNAEDSGAQPGVAVEDGEKTVEEEAKEKEKQAEEAAKDARQLAKLRRDARIGHERVARAHMDQSHTTTSNEAALTDAERELALQQDRHRIFTERSVPNRIERAQLDFARAEDRTKEAEEELRQLEMMYAEEDFADQTKEIVLERGRRRLERSRKDLVLRREELATLAEKTIPLELAEHELRLEQKTRARDKADRAAQSSMLDKHIAVLAAEAEVARVEAEIAALGEKMEKDRASRDGKE